MQAIVCSIDTEIVTSACLVTLRAHEQLPPFRRILKDYGYQPEEKPNDIERAF